MYLDTQHSGAGGVVPLSFNHTESCFPYPLPSNKLDRHICARPVCPVCPVNSVFCLDLARQDFDPVGCSIAPNALLLLTQSTLLIYIDEGLFVGWKNLCPLPLPLLPRVLES